MAKNRVIFFIHKEVHILDLAGAVQAFYEAGYYGHPYDIVYVSDSPGQICSAKLQLAGLKPYSSVKIAPSDIIIVAGFDLRQLPSARKNKFHTWLKQAAAMQATICSVCTGSFSLAEAGLLENRECTTHWKYTDRLKKEYPGVKVLTNRLFVKSDNIYTSAGVTTGIDMVLFLLEERHGAAFVYQVARELVVYIRRDGGDSQESIYLQYRRHINEDIHIVQDWIIGNLQKKIKVEQLATLVYTSPRNLTRLFKATTGITIGQYLEKLRVEKAIHLLHQRSKIGVITRLCGLQSANQLRHIVKKHTGRLPSQLSVRS
ncbi:MAG TPA: DJ-1/PfpI family protein [Puia sp.]|nr:DJ-1/PfpI family protein [Puia sp.]